MSVHKPVVCEKCGQPLSFVKKWTIKGRGDNTTEISLYKCKNGHLKRTGKKV